MCCIDKISSAELIEAINFKADLSEAISTVTGIDGEMFYDSFVLFAISVTRRMY